MRSSRVKEEKNVEVGAVVSVSGYAGLRGCHIPSWTLSVRLFTDLIPFCRNPFRRCVFVRLACPRSCNVCWRQRIARPPVCGTDGRTTRSFDTECDMICLGCDTGVAWRVISRGGPCDSDAVPFRRKRQTPTSQFPECEGTCRCKLRKIFLPPVCAVNEDTGETQAFRNSCFLNCHNCETGENWEQTDNGRC
ncbi:unnamed protein product [Darwinula stevensoni]|uniref:Kazal-like domain-containing protein n=1 Tax=Darwinula stevensoni TaxID=69355 RepID=A0A7R8X3U9_9CRUS|nr:unnamed protein product [Darwinula stevensoni]CAG0879000.1 unnamed protein product [Darwinula stevensoni]